MFQSFRASLVGLLAVAFLAFGAIAPAQAVPVHESSFVADDGQVFQIASAISVEKVANYVRVKYANVTYNFADASGVVYTKILASPVFASQYVTLGGTLRHLNVKSLQRIYCNTPASSWNAGMNDSYNDNCAAANEAASKAN